MKVTLSILSLVAVASFGGSGCKKHNISGVSEDKPKSKSIKLTSDELIPSGFDELCVPDRQDGQQNLKNNVVVSSCGESDAKVEKTIDGTEPFIAEIWFHPTSVDKGTGVHNKFVFTGYSLSEIVQSRHAYGAPVVLNKEAINNLVQVASDGVKSLGAIKDASIMSLYLWKQEEPKDKDHDPRISTANVGYGKSLTGYEKCATTLDSTERGIFSNNIVLECSSSKNETVHLDGSKDYALDVMFIAENPTQSASSKILLQHYPISRLIQLYALGPVIINDKALYQKIQSLSGNDAKKITDIHSISIRGVYIKR